MSLSVIGAGFGRTGTLSIKIALEQLGLGPCYHMETLFNDSTQLAAWEAAVDGQRVDWSELFAGYHSTIDWPGTHYWRELADFYPDAKILLSVRPTERWWLSFSGTIRKLIERRDSNPDEHRRSVLNVANKMIAEQTFGGAMDDKAQVLAAYQKRIDDVTKSIPNNRLLVFDVTEGWGPLCEFLGRPVPETEFPRSNDNDEFWQFFGAGVL